MTYFLLILYRSKLIEIVTLVSFSVITMNPLFMFAAIVLLSSCARGVERTNAAYERVVECFSKGMHEDQGTNLPSQTQMCDRFKV